MTETPHPHIRIRAAQPDDSAFLMDCAVAMAQETEGRPLQPQRLAHGIGTLLREPARGFYLVAERADTRVGTLMVTYEWSDWRGGDFWWIQSVYVLPTARREGVYAALHTAVRARAQAAGAVGLRLYVEQDNARAQQTYRRLGMTPTHYRLFEEEFVAP